MTNAMMKRALIGTVLMLAAAPAGAEPASGRWWNPSGNPVVVGITHDTRQMSFNVFYARCDRAKQTVWLTRLGLKSAPRERVLHFLIDGKRFDLEATPDEDSENGGYEFSGDTYYGAPILAALAHATSVRVTTDGQSLNLPVAGLATAWTSFKRHCGL